MQNIYDYIKLSRDDRRIHLLLEEPCIERGGNSTNFKGLLAHCLGTTIPTGRILLCHACDNHKCSNPNHLYWGTDFDNTVVDGKLFGSYKTPWDRQIEKYGYEEACKLNKRGNKSAGGKANKGKPKSEDQKRKISESLKRRFAINLDSNQRE